MPTNNFDHTFYDVITIILGLFPFFIGNFALVPCRDRFNNQWIVQEITHYTLHRAIHVIFFFTIFLHPDRIRFFFPKAEKKNRFYSFTLHSPTIQMLELRLHYILSLWVFICSLSLSLPPWNFFLLVSIRPIYYYNTLHTSCGLSTVIRKLFSFVWFADFHLPFRRYSHILYML